MKPVAALLLLILQLKPLVGAALCVQNLSTRSECPMPSGESGQAPAPVPQDPGHGCPAAAFCASVAPAIGAFPVVFFMAASEHSASTWFLPGLHSIARAAPPAPPPNN